MKNNLDNVNALRSQIESLKKELDSIRSSTITFSKSGINDSNLIASLGFACKYALLGKTWKSNLEKIITLIGDFLEVSSISIMENKKQIFTPIVEWCNPNLKPETFGIKEKNLDLSVENTSRYYNILNNNSTIKSDTEDFFKKNILLKKDNEIKSIFLAPIIIDDTFWGLVSVTDYETTRLWTHSESDIIQFLVDTIKSSLKRSLLDFDFIERKEMLEKFYQTTPMALVVCQKNGNVLDVNSHFESLFEFNSSEIIGKNIDSIISPSDAKHEAESITEAVSSGGIIQIESIRRPKSGLPIYVSLTGVPIFLDNGDQYVIGIYNDITERKVAEKQLRESQIKYKTLFANSPDGIILLKHDIIIDCNEQALALFQCSRNSFIGESILKFSPLLQEDGSISNKGVQSKINEVLNDKPQRFEWLHISASNEIFPSEVILNKIEIDDSIYIQSIIRNISKRKANEKELLIAKQKAEESDKLKTAFLAHMSHEIRTPLNHILGSIDLITDDSIPIETKEEFKVIVKQSSDDLLRLINNIIDLAMIESDQMEIAKVDTHISELLKTTRKYFLKCIQKQQKEYLNFKVSVPTKLLDLKISVDPERFDQVIFGLIDNAVKFTNRGYIEFGCDLTDDFITFFVKDTGIGIDNDKYSVIFDRFRQVDYTHTREFGGTGLGLTISKEIIEHMGGSIWVDSEPGSGSTFSFTLPVKEGLNVIESNPTKFENSKGLYDWSGKSILIIEDEDVNVQYLKTILDRTNASIYVAMDGQEGLDLILTRKIDLVLMDIQLPVMDGYETTKRIKAHNQNIKVIAQTAHALREDKEKCLAAGCDNYLSKPLKRALLLDMIEELLNFK
ncbi:MAG: response regulator [Bacteroidales bacterium]|nr:response regulator [Bacteroidales bacterium]